MIFEFIYVVSVLALAMGATTKWKCMSISKQFELFARRILTEVEKSYRFEDKELSVTASVGISFYPEHGDWADELVKSADIAIYQSKRKGKNRITVMPSAG